MELREPTLITHLNCTSLETVSLMVSEQFYELFSTGAAVEWDLAPNCPFVGSMRHGTGVGALTQAIAAAFRSASQERFINWKVGAFVNGVHQEWVFGVADEQLPHFHLQLDRLNSAITPANEQIIATACSDTVQRGFADFCCDAKTFTGDKVSLYTYFKRLAVRKREPSLSDQQPGWEHSHFVEKLHRTLDSLRSDVMGSVVTIDWHALLGHMKAIDAVLAPEANRRILEDLLHPLQCTSQEWLNAR